MPAQQETAQQPLVVGELKKPKALPKEEELAALGRVFGKQGLQRDNSEFRINHKARKRTKEDNVLRESFNAADQNGDGAIDKVELAQALKAMGKYESELQVEKIMTALDINGNGTLELRELMAFMEAPSSRSSQVEQEEEDLALAITAGAGTDGLASVASVNELLLREFGIDAALDPFDELSVLSPTKELKADELVKMLASTA